MKMVHVTINTGCLEESIRFYEDIVGLSIQDDFRAAGGNIVFLAKDEGDTQVELIDNPEKAYKGAGISIGFHVKDVEAKREEVIEKGLKPTPIITPNPHVRFFFVEDPNGGNCTVYLGFEKLSVYRDHAGLLNDRSGFPRK